MPEALTADMLKIDQMQTEELQALLSILLSSERQHGPLLRQALEQHMLPECLRPSRDPTCNTRFLHNVMLTGKDLFHCQNRPFQVTFWRLRRTVCTCIMCSAHSAKRLWPANVWSGSCSCNGRHQENKGKKKLGKKRPHLLASFQSRHQLSTLLLLQDIRLRDATCSQKMQSDLLMLPAASRSLLCIPLRLTYDSA